MRFRLIALFTVVAALAVSGIASATSSHRSVVAPTKISVTLKDYSFTFSKSWVKAGTTVVFTAQGSSTTAGLTFEYRFSLSTDGGVTYALQQAYGTTNTWNLPTTLAAGSTYRVMVECRTVGRTNNRDLVQTAGYTLTP